MENLYLLRKLSISAHKGLHADALQGLRALAPPGTATKFALFTSQNRAGNRAFLERGPVRSLLLVLNIIQDASTRTFVRMVLEGAGHRVIDAAGNVQAESLLRNGLDPDLLLCELFFAGLFGSTKFKQLIECSSRECICVVTGVGDQELRDEASALGIMHFLTKPVTRFDLESLVEAATSRSATPASAESARREHSRKAPFLKSVKA